MIDAPARYLAGLQPRWEDALSRPPLNEWPFTRPAAKPDLGTSTAVVPSWLQVPVWLHEWWRRPSDSKELSSRMLDVLWAQYALFLYIRLQDDLLDRHMSDLQLQFVADRFLVESLESLDRARVADAKSRAFYRSCLKSTVDGILQVRMLEASPGQFGEDHLALHARVSSIFTVAAAAVCTIHRRSTELAWLIPLQDALAVFSQICDDIQDLEEDLRAGRYTFAANALIGAQTGETMTHTEAMHRVAEGMLTPARVDRIIRALERAAATARAAVPGAAPAALHELVNSLRERSVVLAQSLHETSVRWIFGEGLSSVGRPSTHADRRNVSIFSAS